MTLEHFQIEVLPIKDKLYRYALSFVIDPALAKDVTQDVLVKLWEGRAQLAKITSIEAWAIRLTRNLCLDRLKAHARKTQPLESIQHHDNAMKDPVQLAEEKDLLQALGRVLQTLPAKQREVFRLRELMGYTNREIEDQLQLSASQVKVYLFRARKRVRAELTNLVNYGLETQERSG